MSPQLNSFSNTQFPRMGSPPKQHQAIHCRTGYLPCPLENGDCYVFKPARDEDPDEDRPAYIPQVELVVYELFRRLQGKYIPKCYGIISLRGKRGLLMENCGWRTSEYPPQDDEKAKFILFMRAMCAMERYMAAGLVHPDPDFRNIIYNPTTLQVRIIDIEGYTYKKPQDIWAHMDSGFAKWFGYNLATSGFWWGLTSIISVLLEHPFDQALYFLVLHYCFCLMKKKMLETFARRFHKRRKSPILSFPTVLLLQDSKTDS